MAIESFNKLAPKVHSAAWVHASAQVIGEVELAEEVSVWPTTVLRGDSGLIRVGARTNLQDGTICHATGGISNTNVGVECTIGHRVILHGCTIGDRCLIGMGSIILDGAVIGADSFVAAGSLVTPSKAFEPGSFIMGSPAKRVRAVTEMDKSVIDHSWRVYLDLMNSSR